MRRRSPHGERGLKSIGKIAHGHQGRRSPHGERGLKSYIQCCHANASSRSPHGERGLKYDKLRHLLPSACVALLTESVD